MQEKKLLRNQCVAEVFCALVDRGIVNRRASHAFPCPVREANPISHAHSPQFIGSIVTFPLASASLRLAAADSLSARNTIDKPNAAQAADTNMDYTWNAAGSRRAGTCCNPSRRDAQSAGSGDIILI
jgi:hypothetical protein